jgi:hypothetical protein
LYDLRVSVTVKPMQLNSVTVPDTPKFYPYDEYLKLKKNPSLWIVDGFLPLGFTNCYAKPKVGKSFLMISIIESIVNGDDEWQGFPISQHGNVMYLQVDTPRELWSSLYMEPMNIQNRKHELYCADMWTVPTYPFNLLQNKKDATLFDLNGNPISDPEWLENQIQLANPLLIIVDTLRESHNEDEDKSGPMKMVLSALQKAAGQGRAVVLISHAKKDSPFTSNSEDDMMDQNRGSTYIPGKMDMIIRMTKKEIHWKGRAVGYQKIAYERDKRGFITLIRDKDGEQSQAEDIINMLSDANPGISKNQLAIKLATLTKVSERTAHRRIDEWNNQNQARVKAISRMAGEMEPPKELLLSSRETLDLETGKIVDRHRGQSLVNLWDMPLTMASLSH